MKDLISIAENRDNMEAMAEFPDNYFDLAIVDPPYGINFGLFNRTNTDSVGNRYKANKYKNTDWDSCIPDKAYFDELFRVSKNQIIWGGNYFGLPSFKCFIYWHKGNPVPNFSDGELAWTSFNKPAKCFDYRYYGNIEGKTSASTKIHPTQKPIQLYKWLLQNFAATGDKILDTHLGSGSSRIAAYDMGFDFWGYEIDADYFRDQEKRFRQHTSQLTLI